jgi:cytochrome b6-f complex iron-sulfur subunit
MRVKRLFDRRVFLNWLLGGSTFAWMGSVIYPVLRFLSPPPEQEAAVSAVKATSLAEMAPNSGKIFKFGRKPALIVRRPDGTFVAFLAKCTHLDCTVQYREDKERIWCACHDGFYDLNGTNVSGPPPRPLDALEVHMQGDDVYVTRKS